MCRAYSPSQGDSHGCFVKLVHYYYVKLFGETTFDEGLLIPVVLEPVVCSSCWDSRGMSKGDTNHHELPAQSGLMFRTFEALRMQIK